MKPLHRAVRQLAHRLGYELIPRWRLSTRAQSDYLQRLFALCGVRLVVDVGANEGQYHDFLRQHVGFDGLILSIEPQPELAARLRRRAAAQDPRWRIVECALGAAPGRATLNLMQSSAFSSLLVPEHGELGLFRESNRVCGTVDVEVRTLQALSAEFTGGSGRDVYLKLDTQGFDLEVLRGAGEALRRVAAAQFEGSFKRLYAGAPGYLEVLDFLRGDGFEISAIHPNNEGHFPLLIEQDFHVIHRELLPASHRVDAQR